MIKGVILDFDQTISDTSSVLHLRNSRKWDMIKQYYHEIKMIKGVRDFLDYLQCKKIAFTILSSAPRRKYLNGILDHLKIKTEHIIGYEDTFYHKPHSEPMRLALVKMKLKPDEVVAIGDDINDCISANNAGIYSILFNDYQLDENVIYTDFQANDFSEIKKHIMTMRGD